MRKRIGMVSIVLICVVAISIAHICQSYYSPATMRSSYKTAQHHDDTLRIAYIGDSWAFMHDHNDCPLTFLSDHLHRPIKIMTYGVCGATSKEIFYHMFDDSHMRAVIESGPDFCVISAGINDTYRKMSTRYYQQSMSCIIRLLLDNHITPVIIEIPDYDIYKAYERQTWSRKALRKILMTLTGSKLDCKQAFREALHPIAANNDSIKILRYKDWNKNGPHDLRTLYLSDGIHLNKEGYKVLDSVIADSIKDYTDYDSRKNK